jgi:hypothetical protein
MGIFHSNGREQDIFLEESNLVEYLAYSASKLYEDVFGSQIAEMRKIIHGANPANASPLQLLGMLRQYRQDAPRHFYLDRIMSGKSAVEKFEDPDVVKDWVRAEFGEVVPERWDMKKHGKEFAYTAVLGEMRGCGGYNDRCFEPLAEMLASQENGPDAPYTRLAFAFSGYVGWQGGSPDCLEGMERESTEVKAEFVDVLDYNAKSGIADNKVYERRLRQRVMAAGTDGEKMEVLAKAGEELRSAKAYYEKQLCGAAQ